jgi:Ankyrin repeats (3 copies)
MPTPAATHNRRTRWALTALEAGAVLFLVGLGALYFNPFWHFDAGGFLDWRVQWWNAGGEILAGAGLVLEALALLGSAAVLVSRYSGKRSWPYFVPLAILLGAVLWILPTGLMRSVNAHFEWNAADGFTSFRLEEGDKEGPTSSLHGVGLVQQSIIEAQIQPLLKNYFKLNDWQKMNGEVPLKVLRIIPIAWPVELGSGGETFEDPDQTELMRAASQEDLAAVQRLLSASVKPEINALDQSGQTALILACENLKASPAVIKALLAAGADVNLRSRNGYTALTWSLARNHTEITRLLRRSGGKP